MTVFSVWVWQYTVMTIFQMTKSSITHWEYELGNNSSWSSLTELSCKLKHVTSQHEDTPSHCHTVAQSHLATMLQSSVVCTVTHWFTDGDEAVNKDINLNVKCKWQSFMLRCNGKWQSFMLQCNNKCQSFLLLWCNGKWQSFLLKYNGKWQSFIATS